MEKTDNGFEEFVGGVDGSHILIELLQGPYQILIPLNLSKQQDHGQQQPVVCLFRVYLEVHEIVDELTQELVLVGVVLEGNQDLVAKVGIGVDCVGEHVVKFPVV